MSTLDIQNLSRECYEALVLSLLSPGSRHGYQLAVELEEKTGGRLRLTHGTLYPILHRLESRGLIEGNWIDEAGRRRRKSYALTAAGGRHLAGQVEAWFDFFNRFLSVLEEGVR